MAIVADIRRETAKILATLRGLGAERAEVVGQLIAAGRAPSEWMLTDLWSEAGRELAQGPGVLAT